MIEGPGLSVSGMASAALRLAGSVRLYSTALQPISLPPSIRLVRITVAAVRCYGVEMGDRLNDRIIAGFINLYLPTNTQ